MSHLVHLYTVPFLWPREENRWQCSWVDDFAGNCLLWQLLSRKTFFAASLGLPTSLGLERSWLFPASWIKFLTPGAWNLGGYSEPHMKVTVSSCWVLLTTTRSALFIFLCMTGTVSETWYHWDMNVFYSDSKTDLKLQCDYCIKFQLFEGAQGVFSRLMAVCCMLLSQNPYVLPQNYKRHFCGLSSSCKLRVLWMSPIFEH